MYLYHEFEVLPPVTVKNTVFLVVTLRSSARTQSFAGKYLRYFMAELAQYVTVPFKFGLV